MEFTVRQLAEIIQGTIHGDPELVIRAASTLQEANPGDITFVENAKYMPQLNQSKASAAIVPPNTPLNGKALIQVTDPLMAFVAVVRKFQNIAPSQPTGIDSRAAIHASAQIGTDPSIHSFCSVGENSVIGKRCQIHAGVAIGKNCRLGDDVVLYPNVVLYDGIVLGNRVIVHANAVIGADGFGYRFHQGRHVKVPQLSNVIIGDDVEIGAGAAIDRGAFGPTRIGEGTKIDNLVQIAHNCQVGKHNLLAGMAALAGSVTTGNYVTLAGQVGVSDHVQIGDRATVAAQSGVTKSVAPGEVLFGMPARPISEQRRIHACEEKLPEIRRDVLRIKKHLGLVDEAKS